MEQHLSPGTTLQNGKYVIVRKLGQGGFGITYEARQPALNKKVAVKECFLADDCERRKVKKGIFSKSTTGNWQVTSKTDSGSFDKYQKKFMKEAQTTANFRHPNIVNVSDVFEENGTVYYVMDFIEGQSLTDIVKSKGALPEPMALHYITKVASALAYIHAQHVNHLDLKPDNIMVCRDDNEPILIDFGVAKHYDDELKQTTDTPVGLTYGYAPLEQSVMGGVSSFSPQADIYSLGATLYALLLGKTPPPAHVVATSGLLALPETISPSTRNAIERCMQTNKDKRPATVAEFLQLLGMEGKKPASVVIPVPSADPNPEPVPTIKRPQPIPVGGAETKPMPAAGEQTQPVPAAGEKGQTAEAPVKESPKSDNHFRLPVLAAAALAACVAAFFLLRSPKSAPVSVGETPETASSVEEPAGKSSASAGQVETDATPPTASDEKTDRVETDQQPVTVSAPKEDTSGSESDIPDKGKEDSQSSQNAESAISGTLDLGYAVWTGGIENGKPHGKGTMTFKSSHLIDSRDIDRNMAGPGDRITGKYSNGNLIFGTWTKSNGETTKLMIGQ